MVKSKKSLNTHTIVGMNNEVALLLIVIVAIIVILFFNRNKCTKDSFITKHMNEGFQNNNDSSNIYIASKNIKVEGDNVILRIGNETQSIPLNNFERGDVIDMNDYYKKGSTVESETIKLLKQKLDTTQNDYDEFRKSILDSDEYKLTASIPKVECPPCITPKVNVDAALCKKCPPVPEAITCDDNNKSQPACVNKYTVITRNIYKKGNNNNSNVIVEDEEQTKKNYNNKMTKYGLNNSNNNSVVEEESFYNSLNKMNRKNNNTNNVRASNNVNNTNNVRANNNVNNTNNVRESNNVNNTNNVRASNNVNNTNNVRASNNVNNTNNVRGNNTKTFLPEKPFGELNHSFKIAAGPVTGY